MPSLFTHLILARDARAQVASPFLRALIAEHKAAYYLGALAPDLPYFDIFHDYRGLPLGAFLSPLGHSVEERILSWLGWTLPPRDGWAQALHAEGTRAILRDWARHARKRHPAFLALVAGMATHVAVDEALHPQINDDSGDPDSVVGMRAHRSLEINLDFVLLRSRGYALEGLSPAGMMESFLGRPQRHDFLSPGQKAAWVETSRACDGIPISRQELERWSHGFSGAIRWLDHRFSPVEQERRSFLKGGEERWRTFFARERYFARHLPGATAAAAACMDRLLSEPVSGSRMKGLAGI